MKLKPTGSEAHPSFDQHREQADRERRLRRAEPITQDGTYGFSEQGSLKQPSGLYSDQMMVDAPAQNRRRRR